MKLTVKLFAGLRRQAGADELEVELGDGASVDDLLSAVGRLALGDGFTSDRLVVAVNREYVPGHRTLSTGDEVALIPPVSGGAPAEPVRAVQLTGDPLDVAALTRLVSDPSAGAVVVFQGTTRDVAALEYEAYTEMALEKMRSIAAEAVERYGLAAVAVAHRTGNVPLAEPSVVVAAAAAHREEAFAGARELIDRIKAEAPIWKAELEEGRSAEWVEGTLPDV